MLMTLRTVLILPILVYQRCISPLLPSSCRFQPTCSEYAKEAVSRLGILRGGLLAVWRLLRCNPLFKGGFDPVPQPSADQMAGRHK